MLRVLTDLSLKIHAMIHYACRHRRLAGQMEDDIWVECSDRRSDFDSVADVLMEKSTGQIEWRHAGFDVLPIRERLAMIHSLSSYRSTTSARLLPKKSQPPVIKYRIYCWSVCVAFVAVKPFVNGLRVRVTGSAVFGEG